MIEKMNRLRELRGLRRSVAERDVERAAAQRADFERKVKEAEDAHARAVTDSSARRRQALDKLAEAPATPLNVARMANVHAAIDQEIATASDDVDQRREALGQAETALSEKRDVLSQFLKKEQATEGAIERHEESLRHLPEEGEEDE